MGFSISYSLALPPPATFQEALAKITRLHTFAKAVGFMGHYDVPAVGEIEVGTTAEPHGECRFVDELNGDGKMEFRSVRALRWVRFMAMPGPGTETAIFGLGEYPKFITAFDPLRSILVDAPQGSQEAVGARRSMRASLTKLTSWNVTSL